MKKSIVAILASLALAAPVAFGDEVVSKTVDIPLADTPAEQAQIAHETILAAAKEVCAKARNTESLSIYNASSERECIETAYSNALKTDTTGLLVASMSQDDEVAGFIATLD